MHDRTSRLRESHGFHVRSDDETTRGEVALLERNEHGANRSCVEATVLCVSHDAHDRAPVARYADEPEHVAGPCDAFPQRVLTREEVIGQRLVDDHHSSRARAVRRLELTSLDERNAGGLEVAWIGRPILGVGHSLAHTERASFGLHIELDACGAQRDRGPESHHFHARERGEIALHALVLRDGCRLVGERREVRRHLHRQDVLRVEAGVDRGQPLHGPHEQPRTGEEHDGYGDLRDDE